MRKTILSFLVSLFLIIGLYAQNGIDQAALSEVVTANAREMAALLNSAKYPEYLKFIHPVNLQAAGGEEKMLTRLNDQHEQMKSKGVAIKGSYFEKPSTIVKSKNELQCTIPQHTELTATRGRVITHATILAISDDNGKSWKFVDAQNMDLATLRKLYPNLSPGIKIPPKQKPTVYQE